MNNYLYKTIDELTTEQITYVNIFNEYINNFYKNTLTESLIISSKARGWGKTTVINHLGYEYQMKGYEVLLITNFPKSVHIATKDITNTEYPRFFIRNNKSIIIVDEVSLETILNIYNKFEYFGIKQCPILGFEN